MGVAYSTWDSILLTGTQAFGPNLTEMEARMCSIPVFLEEKELEFDECIIVSATIHPSNHLLTIPFFSDRTHSFPRAGLPHPPESRGLSGRDSPKSVLPPLHLEMCEGK